MKAPFLALGLALVATHAFAVSALPREAGAVYLEDFVIKPVKLAVIGEAAVYSQLTNGNYLGTLRRGTTAEVLAISDTAIRVRGTAQQGGVAGWVAAAGLTPMKPEFIESVKKNAQRKAEVDALIAKGEVALNMTPEEVTAALGKPQKKTSKLDAKGRQETWEFIRYVRVPQEVPGVDPAGRAVITTVYVKVPAGKLAVTFENNLVALLEQTEGNTDAPQVRLVTPPIMVVY
ncbi:MAG: hypothetical protein ABI318_16045 [Chthoniobacteraceae bacterium]